MIEPTTEPGRWLIAEYNRTPGDPKWGPAGLGLESTVIAIEAEAYATALRGLLEEVDGMLRTRGSELHDVGALQAAVLSTIRRRLEDGPSPVNEHTSHAPLPQGWPGCPKCEGIPTRP
jgi:hypothetical protein